MQGRLHKNASGNNSYEIHKADSEYIFEFANVLRDCYEFGAVKRSSNPAYNFDCIFWDFQKDNILLTVGWDIWSGAFVFAHCSKGDEYIEKIATHFDNLLIR